MSWGFRLRLRGSGFRVPSESITTHTLPAGRQVLELLKLNRVRVVIISH